MTASCISKAFTEMKMKVSQSAREEDYHALRNSADHDSTDGLLEKDLDIAFQRPGKQTFWGKYGSFIALQSMLLVLYSFGVLFLLWGPLSRFRGQPLSHSPASEAIEWIEQEFIMGDKIQEQSIYSGRPTPGLDAAWHDLFEKQNFRIGADQIERIHGVDPVQVPGEDTYLATLNVYHELHCIKRLHRYMYPDYYYAGWDNHSMELNRVHAEHCLDYLRQSIMCHGDVGLVTYHWAENEREPMARGTTHQCVKWDKLTDWVEDRAVTSKQMLTPGWLVHPKLGPSFPDGKGDLLGIAVADNGRPVHDYDR